eukprot:m.25938 g.25938  ORF g.25938 m.25938 type:complete len:954 (+) comp4509_c0_seq1:91-2952(+)
MDWGWSSSSPAKQEEISHEESLLLADIVNQLAKSGAPEEREEKRQALEAKLGELNEQVEAMVDEHQESFLAALRGFFSAASCIDDAKTRVSALRSGLMSCKTLLQCKRDYIRQLWKEHLEYKSILALLDKIEEIKCVPDRVAELMKSKHHVHAAKLLVDTIGYLHGEDLSQVKALNDISHSLTKQKEVLYEVLVEELHNHLYNKGDLAPIAKSSSDQALFNPEREWPDEDLEQAPDADTLCYIGYCIKALSILRKMPETISVLNLRLKSELAHVIDRAVAYAHDQYLSSSTNAPDLQLAQSLAFERDKTGARILFRLLTDVYDRMLQVLRGHIRIFQVVRGSKDADVLRNRTDGAPGAYSEMGVWKAMQIEVELLLCRYLDLGEDEQSVIMATFGEGVLGSGGKGGDEARAHAGKKKSLLFSFANSQNAMIETSVNQERAVREKPHVDLSTGSLNDKYTAGNAPTQRLLCKKTAMNITGIFKPTILFSQEVEAVMELMPAGSRGPCALRLFVDSFVRQTFLHLVREEINTKLKGVSDVDDRPLDQLVAGEHTGSLLQSSWLVNELTGHLCSLMLDLPHYAGEFVMMLQSMLQQYRASSLHRRSALVRAKPSVGQPLRSGQLVLSAEWMQSERVVTSVKRDPSWAHLGTSGSGTDALEDSVFPEIPEADLLIELVSDALLDKTDLVLDASSLKSLGFLMESMDWLASQINLVANHLESSPSALAHQWKELGPIIDMDDEMAMAEISRQLKTDMMRRLRKTAKDFADLAESCLIILRLELRAHCFFYLLPAIRKSNYCCDIDAVETDPLVVSLNKDLHSVEDALSFTITAPKLRYIFDGLDHFLACILIKDLSYIKQINEHGVKRMCRNIFALQQNLTNITKMRASDLDSAMQYYELLYLQGEDVLQSIVANGPSFTENQYRATLSLISASQKVADPERFAQNLQDLGAAFHELV